MANGVVVQFAVISAAILMCVFILYKRRRTQPVQPISVQPTRPAVQKSQVLQPNPERPLPPPIPIERESTNTPPVTVAQPPAVIDVGAALTTREERNERILAGISKNIQKSLQTRPVPQHSPIPYSELKPRNTEYVRVKKEIITPHGNVRFSILKDWMSMNMLAVFRRASLEWKTPDDLIAFIPAYLEAEAEILNGEVLLIGTPGHDEKLAVPIRSLDAASALRDCFDFVADAGSTNTPAVLRASETEFDVIARGVITEAVFVNAIDRGQPAVQLLIERSSEALTV